MSRLRLRRNTARIKKERERSFARAVETLRSEFTSAVVAGAQPERFCLRTLPFRLSATVQWVNYDPTGYGQSGMLLNVEDEYMLEIVKALLRQTNVLRLLARLASEVFAEREARDKVKTQSQQKVIGAAA